MSLSAAGMKTQLHYGIGSRKRFGRGPGRYYRAPKCQPARILRADRQRPAAGVLREQGVGGPLPQPGTPPLGLDLELRHFDGGAVQAPDQRETGRLPIAQNQIGVAADLAPVERQIGVIAIGAQLAKAIGQHDRQQRPLRV